MFQILQRSIRNVGSINIHFNETTTQNQVLVDDYATPIQEKLVLTIETT